jgi:hypothetical protein
MPEWDQVLDWPFSVVADIASSGFQGERSYEELPGRRLLSSKVIQLKGYARAKYYGKPNCRKWSCGGRASRAEEFVYLYEVGSPVAARQLYPAQSGLR